MCTLTGIWGQQMQRTLQNGKNAQIPASNFMMFIYCLLEGPLFNIKKTEQGGGAVRL
jgi:hypothetical protein